MQLATQMQPENCQGWNPRRTVSQTLLGTFVITSLLSGGAG